MNFFAVWQNSIISCLLSVSSRSAEFRATSNTSECHLDNERDDKGGIVDRYLREVDLFSVLNIPIEREGESDRYHGSECTTRFRRSIDLVSSRF